MYPHPPIHQLMIVPDLLGLDLSISKLYSLYAEKCKDNSVIPFKASKYHEEFVTEFNFGFHKPKSDRCDKCEKYKVA